MLFCLTQHLSPHKRDMSLPCFLWQLIVYVQIAILYSCNVMNGCPDIIYYELSDYVK